MTAGINTIKTGLTARGTGQEQYEITTTNFNGIKTTYTDYTYYHNNGQKFNCTRGTLDKCRAECDRWIKGIKINRQSRQTRARLATI